MSEHPHNDDSPTLCPVRRNIIFALAAAPSAAIIAGCSDDSSKPAQETTTTPPAKTQQPTTAGKTSDSANKTATSKSPQGKELNPGEAILASVGGTAMIVTRTADGQYIGYPNVCTHEKGSLAPSGDKIRCSLHGGTFSLDGKPAGGPPQKPLEAKKLTKTADGFALA